MRLGRIDVLNASGYFKFTMDDPEQNCEAMWKAPEYSMPVATWAEQEASTGATEAAAKLELQALPPHLQCIPLCS